MELILQVVGVVAVIGVGEYLKAYNYTGRYIIIYGVGSMMVGMGIF